MVHVMSVGCICSGYLSNYTGGDGEVGEGRRLGRSLGGWEGDWGGGWYGHVLM